MKNQEYAIPEYATAQDIKRVRELLHMTQKEFAQFIGSSKPTVERWESSDKPVTGPVVLLLQMLEKNPEYLETVQIPEKTYPLRMKYMYKQKLCTLIDVDEVQQKVKIKNYADHAMFKAFGVIAKPSYEEYEEFLRSRCFPETRDKMKLVLKDLGIPFYDPMLIIEKTQGKMAEDDFWIDIER